MTGSDARTRRALILHKGKKDRQVRGRRPASGFCGENCLLGGLLAVLTLALGTLPGSFRHYLTSGTLLAQSLRPIVFLHLRFGLPCSSFWEDKNSNHAQASALDHTGPEKEEGVVEVTGMYDVGDKALTALSISLWLQKWQQR